MLTGIAWVLVIVALSGGEGVYAQREHCDPPEASSGKSRGSDHDCRPDKEESPTPEPSPTEEPTPEPTPVPPSPSPAPQVSPTKEVVVELHEAPSPMPTSTTVPTTTASPTQTPEPTVEPTDVPAVLAAVATPTFTPLPTATMTPTATPTLTPTPTAAPVPVITPVSEVQGLVVEAPPLNFLADFTGLGDVSTSLGVIGTNLSLALVTLLLALIATTIFNATLKENAEVIGLGLSRFSMPAMALAGAVGGRLAPFQQRHTRSYAFAKLMGLLALTALIYATLDPHFGFNDVSLVLIIGLMVGLTFTTFLYEGGQVLFSSRALGLPAAIRAYPLALGIAAVCVLLSKVVELNPGVIFGFVAGAALASSGGLGRKEQGLMVLLPMVCVLGVSLIALALIDPLRSLAERHESIWYSLPETAAVAIFVGGAESVLLSLLPLTFNDGQKVWAWNRLAWLAIALPASFLFFHVIVNRHETYGSLLGASSLGPLVAAIIFLTLALATWLYFRLRNIRAPQTASP